jgi:poly-gamma-glutamate synthesis protein (capsule biosynthesis protein)
MKEENNMKKAFLPLSILIIVLLAALGIFSWKTAYAPTKIPIDYSISQKPVKDEVTTLLFVGDIMLDRGVEYMINTEGKGDFKFPFLKIANDLESDILFGNLEGPISDKGTKVGSIYSFRADPKAIEGLAYSGFDVLTLANNHFLDYGKLAFEDTMQRLKTEGIEYVGAGLNETEALSPVIKEINGTKIGFLAFASLGPENWKAATDTSGIAWINEENIEKIKEIIKSTKEKVDVLIVSLHAGEEYQTTPNQLQTSLDKAFIDAGADLVIGHHPHVVQPVEEYKTGWIAYSLGNFIFDQAFSEQTMEGQMIKALIEDKKIKEVIPIKIKMNEFYQPQIVDK